MAPPRRTFQPLITASKWETAWRATAKAAKERNGSEDVDGVETPRLSNGDAVTLIKAWLQQSGAGGFPLWYQFAAAAYGWDPTERHGGMAFDALNTTAKQRASLLDVGIARELWSTMSLAARNLDDSGIAARLELDDNAFEDPVFQASVRAGLKGDGSKMRVQFKIPVGCKDPKTGKATTPKLKCRDGFELERVGSTVPPVYICRNKQTGETEQPTIGCEGETITVDDPITGLKKILGKELAEILLIVGGIWLVARLVKDDD